MSDRTASNVHASSLDGEPVAMDIMEARVFVEPIDLSGTPCGVLVRGAATEPGEALAKNRTQVVDSGIFAFAEEVDAVTRKTITNSALLALLTVKKRAPFERDPSV
jgi:hypothetical protein